MKLIERDLKTFYYAAYSDRQMIYENELPTGEYTKGYGEPVEKRGTFSTASGRATEREFGTFIDYDYVIHIEDDVCPFDENAAIWLPGSDPTGEHDAKVTRISDPPSHIAIAVKKVR